MPKNSGDDVDDFMAGLLGGGISTPPQPAPRIRPVSRPSISAAKPPTNLVQHKPHRQSPVAPTRPRTSQKENKVSKRTFLVLPATIIAILAGFFLWNGPISGLLEPKSPFEPELQEKVGIPLYFPTKLPEGFKIETNSISQPESNVVIYAVSDDTNQKITISLQRQPEGINLDPLYENLSSINETDTQYGTVKVGKSEDNIYMANVLTGETWVIITSQNNILDTETIKTIVNNLRA